MESHKVFPRRSLLCLVVVSLLYLIDNTQGFSSNLTHPTENSPTKEIQGSSAEHLTNLNNSNRFTEIETTTTETKLEPGREEGARHLFLGPNVHRKRKPVLIQRNTKKTSKVQISSKPNLTLSDKMDDGEFSFDNSTETEKRNRTVITHDKDDLVIVQEDNFCPEGVKARVNANTLQSTLPFSIFMLTVAVHILGLVVFLYFWKTFFYYEVLDPYETVSPYGIAAPGRRSQGRMLSTEKIDTSMDILEKSIVNMEKKK